MCIWSTFIYQYIWKMLWTYQYFSFESVHGEAMLKMGWVVKKWIFSFWKAINWSKCILMVSVYIWLSIYTNNAILCIIWKFDLSSWGVLGRIYALSIEVLWPCCKKSQGQPRVIIWINLVVMEHPMLHTKFQGRRPFGSGEEAFFRFLPYIGMAAMPI